MKAYYERWAAKYDDWWLGTGLFANRHRPGWHEKAAALTRTLEALPPARTLDVACGSGFLTRHLRGEITGLDQSASMLELARTVVDSALHDEVEPVEWQERVLNDGSRWQVYKRFFEPDPLAEELGGGRTLFARRWFVAVQA